MALHGVLPAWAVQCSCKLQRGVTGLKTLSVGSQPVLDDWCCSLKPRILRELFPPSAGGFKLFLPGVQLELSLQLELSHVCQLLWALPLLVPGFAQVLGMVDACLEFRCQKKVLESFFLPV